MKARTMNDAEVIASAKAETDKVRKWPGRRAKRYVLLELEVAERLVALAEERLSRGGEPKP